MLAWVRSSAYYFVRQQKRREKCCSQLTGPETAGASQSFQRDQQARWLRQRTKAWSGALGRRRRIGLVEVKPSGPTFPATLDVTVGLSKFDLRDRELTAA